MKFLVLIYFVMFGVFVVKESAVFFDGAETFSLNMVGTITEFEKGEKIFTNAKIRKSQS